MKTRRAPIFCTVKWTSYQGDVPGDVLKLLGEDGLKIIAQLINNIYETGESCPRI
jgi:hypothetical protein